MKILGWAPKVAVIEMQGNLVDACPSFKYTDEEKLTRIKSIVTINPPDALKLIRDVLNN